MISAKVVLNVYKLGFRLARASCELEQSADIFTSRYLLQTASMMRVFQLHFDNAFTVLVSFCLCINTLHHIQSPEQTSPRHFA